MIRLEFIHEPMIGLGLAAPHDQFGGC